MNFTEEELANEEWRQCKIVDYFEISNLGRVRSKDRFVNAKNNSKKFVKGIILNPKLKKSGFEVYVK